MKHPRPFSTLAIAATLITTQPLTASAAGPSENIVGASTHASQAVSMGVAASGQVTLGIMATPLLSVGAVGNAIGGASTAAGKTSAEAAGLYNAGPLPITEEAITVTPPAEALKQRNATAPR